MSTADDDIAKYRKQIGHDNPDCDYLYEDQEPVRAWPEREAPVLSRRFCCRLDDGWYLVERTPSAYHCTPIDGWHMWWWRFRANIVEATWRGIGTTIHL